MPAQNSVTICGHVTRDPELRYLPNATTAICQFGVAVTKRWSTKDGKKEEKTSFFDVKIWGTSGEEVAEHVRKGDGVIVVGELEMESWTDKASGANRSKIVIKADAVGKALYRNKDGKPSSKQPQTATEEAALPLPSGKPVPF